MLLGIEPRGRDAAGFAFIDSTGVIQAHKRDVPASVFLRQRRMTLPKRWDTALLHTRAATQGVPEVNENNHPIVVGGGSLVGVHNGWLTNDDALFARYGMPRIAEVDSEAIFAGLYYAEKEPTEFLEELSGPAAVAWLRADTDDPKVVYLARASTNPLIVVQSTGKSLVFASTEAAALDAMAEVGMAPQAVREVEEGTLLTVKQGEVLNVQTFDPDWSFYSTRRSYSGSYSGSPTTYRSNSFTMADRAGIAADKASRTLVPMPRTLHLHDVGTRGPLTEQLRLLFDPSEPTPMPQDHWRSYSARQSLVSGERAARRQAYASEPLLMEQRLREVEVEMGGGIRTGDAVYLTLAGEWHEGEIVLMPDTFPGGFYLIRVWIENGITPDEYEMALLYRKRHEFMLSCEVDWADNTPTDEEDALTMEAITLV